MRIGVCTTVTVGGKLGFCKRGAWVSVGCEVEARGVGDWETEIPHRSPLLRRTRRTPRCVGIRRSLGRRRFLYIISVGFFLGREASGIWQEDRVHDEEYEGRR